MNIFIKQPRRVFFVFIISLFSRLCIAAGLGAGFDEAYYYSYSLRPSLSYFDHPPFVGFLAGLFPTIIGIANHFTIRLGAILLFSLAGLMLYQFAKKLVSEDEAFFTYLLFNITPLFSLGAGTMILPDSGLVFFWILSLWILQKLFFKNHDTFSMWILGGLLAGLAMLSKYHGVLLILSLFMYILFYHRKLLISLKPYSYAIISLIVFLPVIIWNLKYNFISFTFQGSRAVNKTISINGFIQGLGGQAGYLTPMIFIPLMLIIWLTIWQGVIQKDKKFRFYFFFGSIPVLLVNLISFFRPILPHWTLPGYILLLLPFAALIANRYKSQKWVRTLLKATIILTIILLTIAFLHTKYGIFHLEKMADRGWISQKDFQNDATLDVVGWNSVNDYLISKNINPDSTFIFTNRWYLSGEVDLAVRGKYTVMCFNDRDPRGFGIWDSKLDVRDKDGIFICTNRYKTNPYQKYNNYFSSISKPDSITIKRGGIPSKIIYFYTCQNLLKKYPIPYSINEKL